MRWKALIAMFVAFGLLAMGGIAHALLIMKPNGTKTQGQVVGNQLMLQTGPGKTAPAADGIYKTGDGKQIVVKGGIISPASSKSKALPGDQNKLLPAVQSGSPGAARGGMVMDKDKPGMGGKDKPKPEKKGLLMTPGAVAPGAARGGQAMESDKPTKPDETDQGPPPKPDKKGLLMDGLGMRGQGPAGATPMPQGTQGSMPSLGSPKDPMGPGAGSRPGGGPPPPLTR